MSGNFESANEEQHSIERLKRLKDEFNAYFLVEHAANVNLVPLKVQQLPTESEFEASIPDVFKMATELSEVEAKALRPLRSVADRFDDLIQLISLQSKKIDIIMGYVLMQQDEERHRYQSVRFGGAGIEVVSSQAMPEGTLLEVKLFVQEEHAAIYAIGEVIQCEQLRCEQSTTEPLSESPSFKLAILYQRLREDDQEVIVRSTLHLQTAQLKRQRTQREHANDN